VRNFADRPNELRFGLPGSGQEWRRLEAALAAWSAGTSNRGGGDRAVRSR
jgi:hypothetical protein